MNAQFLTNKTSQTCKTVAGLCIVLTLSSANVACAIDAKYKHKPANKAPVVAPVTYENETSSEVESVQTGRYSFVKNLPPVDQLNPLKVIVKTRIPQSVHNVGDAVKFLLVRSGYSLADDTVLSKEAKALLSLPLPQVHRNIGPMTLDLALQTLGGEAFALVVDPVHRKVAFELSEKLITLQ